MKERSEKNYKALALMPMLLFLVLYVGCGIVFTIMGKSSPFSIMSRYTAILITIMVALLCYDTKVSVSNKLEVFCRGYGTQGVGMLAIIVLMAGAFQSSATAMGGKDSIVNMGISLIPAQFLVPGIFILSCFISTCIGSAMGTQVAMIPVAMAIAQKAGLNIGMAGATCIAGAYFGDNLSVISDTTICATKGVGAEMRDKFRMNVTIAAPAAIITIALYWLLGRGSGAGVAETEELTYSVLEVLPYVVVLGAAIAGVDVIIVMLIGIVMSGVIGMAMGTIGFFDWAMAVSAGMEDMFYLAVFAAMVSGMIELIRYYGGMDWLVSTMSEKIKSSKSCQYVISLISMAIAGITLNNTVAIIISAPIAKELGGKYKIAPKRLASLLDIFACAALMLVPHDSAVLLVSQYGGASYGEIIRWQFYPVLLLLFTVCTIQFGLLRTKDEKNASV